MSKTDNEKKKHKTIKAVPTPFCGELLFKK